MTRRTPAILLAALLAWLPLPPPPPPGPPPSTDAPMPDFSLEAPALNPLPAAPNIVPRLFHAPGTDPTIPGSGSRSLVPGVDVRVPITVN